MVLYENEIPAEEEPPRIRAEELEQYSDAQLQEFLLHHERCDNGYFTLPIDLESWKALPSEAAQLLVARLQTTTIMGSELDDSRGENERGDYHLLLADGGRPFYSIEKLDAVQQDPDSYYDLIGPWKHLDSFLGGLFENDVFQRQLDRWEQFHRWQLEHRNQDAQACEKHIEKVRTMYARFAGRCTMHASLLAELDDPADSFERDRFQARDRVRKLTLQWLSQGGHLYTGFSNYTEDARRCLTQHGFLDHIDLDLDPKKQDELTTWAEYVHFEFWWLAVYEGVLERATPKMRRQWEKLHEQGIFDKDETFDVVRSEDFRKQLWREKEASLSVVQRLRDQFEFGSGSTTERDPKAEERMRAAQKNHEPIEEKFKAVLAVQNRGQFLKYAGYLQSHKSLFQWTLDQFRQIQAGIGPLTKEIPLDRQDPPVNQENTGISTAMQRLATESIMCQGASASRDSTDATHGPVTMVGVGHGTSLTARGVAETKAARSRERPHLATEDERSSREVEPMKMHQQSSARREDKAQESEPGPASTPRKRKRDPTAEEIEASIQRKKSLRTLERKNYKV